MVPTDVLAKVVADGTVRLDDLSRALSLTNAPPTHNSSRSHQSCATVNRRPRLGLAGLTPVERSSLGPPPRKPFAVFCALRKSPVRSIHFRLEKTTMRSLDEDFIFRPLPALEHTIHFPFPLLNPLGPLANLPGTWGGYGFNMIWRAQPHSRAGPLP